MAPLVQFSKYTDSSPYFLDSKILSSIRNNSDTIEDLFNWNWINVLNYAVSGLNDRTNSVFSRLLRSNYHTKTPKIQISMYINKFCTCGNLADSSTSSKRLLLSNWDLENFSMIIHEDNVLSNFLAWWRWSKFSKSPSFVQFWYHSAASASTHRTSWTF